MIPPAAMKPNRKDVGYYMRLSAEDKEFLLKMGGVRWIRQCLELARNLQALPETHDDQTH